MESDDSRTDGQSNGPEETTVPADPYLVVVRGVKRLLAVLNRSYARFETLPGWTRIGSGTLIFLFSIYYGRPIKKALNNTVSSLVTPVLGDLVQISFETLVVLFLLVLVSIQALFINLRLDALREQVEERFNVMEGKMDQHMGTADDVAPDGGHLPADGSDSRSADSSGAGALSGAAAGAALGAPFGPGAVVGGAIMGAIVGDEVEKSSIRNRKRRNLEAKIVRKLLMKGVDRTNPIRPVVLCKWFPADEAEDVKGSLDGMVDDASVPVTATDSGEIHVTDFEAAFTFLDSRGW